MSFLPKSFFVFGFLVVFSAQAFKTDYVSFDLPKTWTCKQFGTSYVCHEKAQTNKVEALITVTAKIAGSWDKTDNYLNYLQKPKVWSTKTGETITSKPLSKGGASYIYPNGYMWVDSTHKYSEVKSYISRYAGTVCCEESSSKLGILVVLSAHEEHWTKYASIFLKAVNSLKVLDIEKAISKVRASDALQSGMDGYLEGLLEEGGVDGDLSSDGSDDLLSFLLDPTNLVVFSLAGLGGGTLLLLKRKKRASSRRRRRKKRRK